MLQKWQFKTRDSEIKYYTLCLGNISKYFTINNMKKEKKWLKGSAIFFSVDFHPIDANYILDIHKYLMKKALYKTMYGLIQK